MGLLGAVSAGTANRQTVDTPVRDTTGAVSLAVGISVGYFNGTPYTLTDSYNNVWVYQDPGAVLDHALTEPGDGRLDLYVAQAPVIVGPGHTIHVQTSTNREPACVFAWFDVAITLPFSLMVYNRFAAYPCTVGSGSPGTPQRLLLGLCGSDYFAGCPSWSVDNGFTIADQIASAFPHDGLALAYRIDGGSPGTIQATWSTPPGTVNCTAVIWAFDLACVSPTITLQPSGTTLPPGEVATLTVVAEGAAPLTYQWYIGNSGDTSNPIPGATAATYLTPEVTVTRTYWVRVTNDCGHEDSDSATITVEVTPFGGCVINLPAGEAD